MNNLEEKIWTYIDGTCTATEKEEIETSLASDSEFNKLYKSLLVLHQQLLTQTEIEEPSMSFTRNVMEQVTKEFLPATLKTKVNQKIIYAIGGCFLLALLSLLGFAIATTEAKLNINMSRINWQLQVPEGFNSAALLIFVFVDLVLLLIYLDIYLRRGSTVSKQDHN